MAGKPILTTEDLAERWSVSPDSALAIVREFGVPFLQLANKQAGCVRGRKRYRFWLKDIESWEEKNTLKSKKGDQPALVATDDSAQEELAKSFGSNGIDYLK